MPYNIKQKTQANMPPPAQGDKTRTIWVDTDGNVLYTKNTKNDVFSLQDNNTTFQVANFDQGTSLGTIENEDTLSVTDYGYSESGGDPSAEQVDWSVIIGGQTQPIIHSYYKLGSLGTDRIIKLGYCCNSNEGKDYPIFLEFNGEGVGTGPNGSFQFYPGKEGMYEFQPEYWQEVNETEETAEGTKVMDGTTNVTVKAIWVPMGFNFVLDYCY